MIDPNTPWNSELIRYLFVFAAAPIWIPFLKALWKELLRAMRAEGGLYGATPSRRRREEIEREIAQEPDPVVHEPIANRRRMGEKRGGAAAGGSPGRPAPFSQRRPNAAPPESPRRRGFR